LVGSLERREPYRHNFFRRGPAVQVLLGHDKLLSIGQADRDYHFSARLELVELGRWGETPSAIAKALKIDRHTAAKYAQLRA
jgi:hypothetical protein